MSNGMQYTDAPNGYVGEYKWMNFGGKRVMVGPGRKPFFLNMIRKLINNQEACVMVITSKGGKGKSYMALRIAEDIDPKFNPELQVVFDRRQMLDLISEDSPLKRKQVILIDEAQFSMGGRNWHEQMQKDLMEQMEAIRSKGLIIILVALGVDLLDIVMRKHVINFRIHMERRGVATVYTYDSHRFTGKEIVRKLGEIRRPLPGWKDCQAEPPLSCLTCEYSGITKGKWKQREKWEQMGFRPCNNIRNRYEIMKKEYVEMKNRASVTRADEDIKKKTPINKDEMVKYLLSLNTSPPTNRNGNADRVKIGALLGEAFKDKKFSRDLVATIVLQYENERDKISQKNAQTN